jgi:ATP dependent DNA ligase C terminal region
LIIPVDGTQVGGYIENRGIDLFRLAKEKGLEWVIAKRKSSIYRPGKRSPDWLKIKSRPQQEFIVCGLTKGKGSRKHFGALLLGAYRNGKLRYFGHSGTGFSERGMKETIDRLKPLFTDKPTVENPPKIPEKIQWVQPKLVCEVAFAEWTLDGELRQTTFLGRDDKRPEEVVIEIPRSNKRGWPPGTGWEISSGSPCRELRSGALESLIAVFLRKSLTQLDARLVNRYEAAVASGFTTMSARVLSTIAFSSACSCAGTLNLSSVC